MAFTNAFVQRVARRSWPPYGSVRVKVGGAVIEGNFSDIPTMALLDEPRTARLVLHMVRHLGRGTFIDVGAHIGEYSIPIAKAGLDVVAIEPLPRNYRMLEHNARANGVAGKITIMRTAVSSEIGETFLYFSDKHSGAGSLMHARSDRKMLISTTKLSEIIKSIGKAEAIKIDIEGEEAKVISEASPHISSIGTWIVEVTDESELEVVKKMRGAGYSCRRIERLVRGSATNLLCKSVEQAGFDGPNPGVR